MSKMNFGQALEAIKQGKRISREGWNGKGLCLELQRPDAGSKMTLPYIYLVYPLTVSHPLGGDRVPWAASQTDALAEDWVVVGEPVGIDMPPHQLRVVFEKGELDERLSKLDAFILDNPLYLKLDEAEQLRLKRQSLYMGQYSDVLDERIRAFSAPAEPKTEHQAWPEDTLKAPPELLPAGQGA